MGYEGFGLGSRGGGFAWFSFGLFGLVERALGFLGFGYAGLVCLQVISKTMGGIEGVVIDWREAG